MDKGITDHKWIICSSIWIQC